MLGMLSLAHADLKPTYAIYKVTCGEAHVNRTVSKKYCINKVAGTALQVFSIEAFRNGVSAAGSEYYLIVNSYDVERQSSDGLLAVIVPAKRVIRLEKAEVTAPEAGASRYAILKAVEFSKTNVALDAQESPR